MLLNKRIPIYYIFQKIRRDLLIVTIISITVYFLQSVFINILPLLPVNIPIFLGTAISLILSFKLNQSYERWWEARKIWGAIVNDSRTLIIQLKSLLKPGQEEFIKKVTYRQIAWCYCLGQSLRKQDALKNMDKFLDINEVETLKVHTNKPLALLEKQSLGLSVMKNKGNLETFDRIQLDNTIARLTASMGKAERINNTVFPITYSLFLHSLIYIFIILLSISLSEIDGLFEIPLLILISVPFLLLEKTAGDMQDPFSNKPTDTSVTTIARSIEINLKQLINEMEPIEPLPDYGYYVN